jgi:peptidoglycan/xylan/chitin deacetylase (PgdA/CDA1 family)
MTLETDPQLLAVSPGHFDEHMEVLKNWSNPLRLEDLVSACGSGRVLGRAVIVTFDDGYGDNLYNAKPILERHGIPATVFVATHFTDKRIEFCSDELDRLLLQPGVVPPLLELDIAGNRLRWNLGASADYTTAAWQVHRRWNVLSPDAPTPRHQVYRELHRLLRAMRGRARETIIASLQNWAEAGCDGRATHRALSVNEVARLSDGGLVEIGAHTETHPVLSALLEPEQEAELRISKDRLEEILGRPVTAFAYPYGSQADYGPETVLLVRKIGFASACANFPRAIRNASDVYQLPRFLVRDWDGDEFSRRLKEWFGA